MAINILEELYEDLPGAGSLRFNFTRRAYQMLPIFNAPLILDIGSGRGDVTMELAKLSQGQLIGIDIIPYVLDVVAKKAIGFGLQNHIHAVNCSMFALSFPIKSFDVIWCEGSIHMIGFERGLREWHRFIRPDGFLVVHEMTWLQPDPPNEILNRWKRVYPEIKTANEYLDQIRRYGYKSIGHFPLPEDVWWCDCYGPLETRINELRDKYNGNRNIENVLDNEQYEVDLYKKYYKWYGSAFYLMQKRDALENKKI
jgi:ubiquinone/menaquinone biosynthesis C-methylase UbiE